MHYPNSSMTQHNSAKRPSVDGARDGGREEASLAALRHTCRNYQMSLLNERHGERKLQRDGRKQPSGVEGRFIHKMKSSRTKLNYCWNGIMGAVYSAPAHRWKAIPLKAFQWINASPHLPHRVVFSCLLVCHLSRCLETTASCLLSVELQQEMTVSGNIPISGSKIVLVKLF